MNPISNSYYRAILNIVFTGNWISDRTNCALRPFGISEQQFNVLRILRGQKGKPVSMSLIQERMIHRMSNATRLVEKLRQKGFVEREINPLNRRKVDIIITQAGLDVVAEASAAIDRDRNAVEENLSEEELQLVGNLLDKLRG